MQTYWPRRNIALGSASLCSVQQPACAMRRTVCLLRAVTAAVTYVTQPISWKQQESGRLFSYATQSLLKRELCVKARSMNKPGVVEYFGTRINRNRFRNILGYFGTIPIYPPPSGRIFRNRQDISEPPPSLWDAQYLTLHNK